MFYGNILQMKEILLIQTKSTYDIPPHHHHHHKLDFLIAKILCLT